MKRMVRIGRTGLACFLLLGFTLAACGEGDPADGADGIEAADDETSGDGMDGEAMATDEAGMDGSVGGGLVNPNLATEAELAALPGMSVPLVQAVMAERPFADMLAVDAALAAEMEESEREALYGEMWIPLDLNTASEEEILLIPGVGPRMAHEFEEYRPYDAMARFRREIGKYVDEDEVARLERYVTIRG